MHSLREVSKSLLFTTRPDHSVVHVYGGNGLSEPYQGKPDNFLTFLSMIVLQDRSLGSIDLRVSDLARESSTDPKFRHESIGRKEAAQPIQVDGGKTFKGQLHFVAEFIPALALKDVGFDAGENEIQKAVKTMNGITGGEVVVDSSSSTSARSATVDRPIAESGKHAAKSSQDTNVTDASQEGPKSQSEEGEPRKEDEKQHGLELSKEELLKHRTSTLPMTFARLTLY